jgi:hypothetical protein
MVDDLVGIENAAAGEERNLGFRVLGVLGFKVRGLAGVREDLEGGQGGS